MKCFNHPENDAVGICKVCQKGLCRDCLTDLGHGVACKGVHEERASVINALIERNAQVQGTAKRAWYLAPAMVAFTGAIFAGFGLHESPSSYGAL